jgi:hypothetical protein
MGDDGIPKLLPYISMTKPSPFAMCLTRSIPAAAAAACLLFAVPFASGQTAPEREPRAPKPRVNGTPYRSYPFERSAEPAAVRAANPFATKAPADAWNVRYSELQGTDAAVNPTKPLTPEDRARLEAKLRYRDQLQTKGMEQATSPAPARSGPEPTAMPPAVPKVDAEGAATYGASSSTVPDGTAAVSGGGYILSSNNTHVEVFNEEGTLVSSLGEDDFWAVLEPTANIYDPRILYDALNNRFVIVALHGNSSTLTELYLGFSLTSNPLDGFWFYEIDGNPGDPNLWFDYPNLACNGDDIIVSGNMFTNGSNFSETKIFLFDASDGYSGNPLSNGYFDNVEHNSENPFNFVPTSYPFGGYGPGAYLWTRWNYDVYLLGDITDDLAGSPTLNTFLIDSPYNNPAPTSAPQADTNQMLTVDERVQSAYYGGDGKIFYALAYGDDNGNDRVLLGRYNVSNENHAQQGFGATGWDYAYPCITPWASSAATFDGKSTVAFLRVSSDTYPEFRVAIGSPTDGFSNSVGVKAGESPITTTARWGDYLGAGYRENTGHKESWIYGQYGKNNDHALWVAQVVDEIYGCTSSSACNYNPAATASDGSCEYTSCSGCTDPEACNFDPLAELSDGSCTYPGCTQFGACNYVFGAGCDDGSCCFGHCLDLDMSQGFIGFPPFTGSSMLYYSIVDNVSGATVASGSNLAPHHDLCLPAGCYTATFTGAAGATWELSVDPFIFFPWSDYDLGNGSGPGTLTFQLGNGGPLAGCTDAGACNFNPEAVCDNGTCCYATCVTVGMEDSYGDGWNGSVWEIHGGEALVASGTLENGYAGEQKACLAPGCYTFHVNTSDGMFPYEISWSLEGAAEGLISGTFTTTASFTIGNGGEDAGCMDYTACNFDPYANCDDGSCCYANCGVLLLTDTWGDGWNGAELTLSSPGGLASSYTLADGQGSSQALCLTDGCYDVEVTPGVYPNEVGWSLAFGNYVIQGGAPHDDMFSLDAVFGCTVAGACNFNPAATCNLGLCTFPGCMDPEACTYLPTAGCSLPQACTYGCLGCTYPTALNYNADATTDDGSCLFDGTEQGCSTDVNGDGIVNVGDLLLLLGDFGVLCSNNTP